MTAALVLIVDHDAGALSSACAALSAAGYAVNQATNGRQAMQRVSANPPIVIITEILMPDVDGIELMMAMRRSYPRIRIIAVTERRFMGKLDLLDLALKLGADAVLDKPLTPKALLAVMGRLVGFEHGEANLNSRSTS